MFRLTKPSVEDVDAFLQSAADDVFTYPEQGATLEELPLGYRHDRYRVVVGQGESAFRAARLLIENWSQFRLGWTELCWQCTPIRVGQRVAVLGHVCGLWSLNACRIGGVVDEDSDERQRFGFWYGTLKQHAARGEEAFTVDWDKRSGEVTVSITAFSKPNEWLAHIFGFYFRRKQHDFKQQSLELLKRLVQQMETNPEVPAVTELTEMR